MPNRLASATSPYLRQHAGNPVDWEEWGERAFRRAREEDKPILLSVGYAACHWCHVMAHESFESPEIARLMNEGFVSVKVDREERPDVDQVYQAAVQLMGVGGGWPLTAFLLPDGRPFFGGTYFPPDDRYGRPGFSKVLASIREAWEKRREEVQSNAEELLQGMKEVESFPVESGEVIPDLFERAAVWLVRHTDPEEGGLGTAPKFPHTGALEVMLRRAHRHPGTDAPSPFLEAALFSLGKMAEGGIYDQVGGGFHRYSVDERWHVPHFEKMLYDNALLARAYVLAWQLSRLPWCRQIALETLEYLRREMRSPAGAFYASTDADSADEKGHPEEGAFFVWRLEELEKLLGEDGKLVALRYGMTKEGNWEEGKKTGSNVLHLTRSEEDVARESGRPLDEVQRALSESVRKMFQEREKRSRPFRDEKILTSWNGLAISALARAGSAFDEPSLLGDAIKAMEAVLSSAWDGKQLLRAPWPGGEAPRLTGTIDDYANLAEAALDLWEATLETRWLDLAAELGEGARRFAGPDGEIYLTPEEGEKLVHRPLSLHDQSTPAGSGVIARVWLRLARLNGKDELEGLARKVITRHRLAIAEQPVSFTAMLCAMDDLDHPVDAVLAGPLASEEAKRLLKSLRARFEPSLCTHLAPLLAGSPARSPLGEGKTPSGGRPTVYVCRDRTCSPPVTEPAELEKLI